MTMQVQLILQVFEMDYSKNSCPGVVQLVDEMLTNASSTDCTVVRLSSVTRPATGSEPDQSSN